MDTVVAELYSSRKKLQTARFLQMASAGVVWRNVVQRTCVDCQGKAIVEKKPKAKATPKSPAPPSCLMNRRSQLRRLQKPKQTDVEMNRDTSAKSTKTPGGSCGHLPQQSLLSKRRLGRVLLR